MKYLSYFYSEVSGRENKYMLGKLIIRGFGEEYLQLLFTNPVIDIEITGLLI